MYGLCMGYVWAMYELCMASVWAMYELCISYVWLPPAETDHSPGEAGQQHHHQERHNNHIQDAPIWNTYHTLIYTRSLLIMKT